MRTAKIFTLCLFAFAVSLFSSCDKDCGTCGPLQTCQNGTCQCTQGLEGANCDIYSVDKFEGAYQVYESYSPQQLQGQSSQTFNCNLARSGNQIDKVWFDNFAGLGISVYGIINTVYITIPDQSVNGGVTQVAGEGTFNTATRRIDLKYQITNSNTSTVATSAYQHQ